MITRFERHLSSLSSFLILVSAPSSALAQTTILEPGDTHLLAEVKDNYFVPGSTIDSEFVVIHHAPPGSASVSASGAAISNPSSFGSASGSGSAGLDSNVFSAHWSGQANVTNAVPTWLAARSFFCTKQDGPWCTIPLWFEVSAPTPFTLAASGTVSLLPTGGGYSHLGLVRHSSLNGPAVEIIVNDDVSAYSPQPSDSFERRLSTTLNPGFYRLSFEAWAQATSAGHNASASLDVVMTLSPVGDWPDGLDYDGDALADLNDPDCADGTDTNEAASPASEPALGTAGRATALTAILLLALDHLRARRRA